MDAVAKDYVCNPHLGAGLRPFENQQVQDFNAFCSHGAFSLEADLNWRQSIVTLPRDLD
jgi:hypothetical protein